MCIQVHICAGAHAYMFMYVPVPVEAGVTPQELCSLFSHLHVSLCVSLSLACCSLIRLGLLTASLRDPAFAFPVLQAYHFVQLFNMKSGD